VVLEAASRCDLVIKHSGVGVDDELLERCVVETRRDDTRVAFWDVDAPATLSRVEDDLQDPFRALISQYDFVFTYGGGQPVIDHYIRLGAQNCHPIYNALDPEHHYTVAPQPELACDLVFVGNRLPDREKRVEEFFLRVASLAPEMSFILGGEGWGSKWLPSNVRWIGHVGTGLHNAVNCSARMVLNVNRESMASVGFSPPTRVFEAAGAGACLITDEWTGVETFFEPEREILVASSAQDVIAHLRTHSAAQSKLIGTNMRDRALRDHTSAQRGLEVQQILAVVTAEVAA
jgi:spore maturation protein CgeB